MVFSNEKAECDTWSERRTAIHPVQTSAGEDDALHCSGLARNVVVFCNTVLLTRRYETARDTYASFQKLKQVIQKDHGALLVSRAPEQNKLTGMSHLAKDVFGYPSCEEAFDVLLDSRVHVIKEHIVSVPCSTSSHATCSSAVDSEADDGDSTAENWETQFARYRLDCTKDVHQLIDVDSHLHPLLATSSICVLQKRKKYENPLPTSVQDMLRKLLLEKRLEKFDAQIAAAIRDIVMDYEGENASKTEARIKLVQFFMEQAAWKPSGQGSRRY